MTENLRWALYENVYYPVILQPSDDVPEGQVMVFFLGFDNGAAVPVENIFPFDINDTEKTSNPAIQVAMSQVHNFLALDNVQAEDDVVSEDDKDMEAHLEEEERERKRLKKLKKKEKKEKKKAKKEMKEKKKKEAKEKRKNKSLELPDQEEDSDSDDDDSVDSNEVSREKLDKKASKLSNEWKFSSTKDGQSPFDGFDQTSEFDNYDYDYDTKRGTRNRGKETEASVVQQHMMEVAVAYENLRQQALLHNCILSVSEKDVLRLLEVTLRKNDFMKRYLESQLIPLENVNDTAAISLVKHKIEGLHAIDIQQFVEQTVQMQPVSDRSRTHKGPDRFYSQFCDLSLTPIYKRASERAPGEASLEKLSKYVEQKQRGDRLLNSLRGLGKLGLHSTAPKPFEKWKQNRELMILSNVEENQPVPPPGAIPRKFSQTAKRHKAHALEMLAKNQEDPEYQEAMLKKFQRQGENQNRRYPVYHGFNDLTIDSDAQVRAYKEEILLPEQNFDAVDENKLPPLSVGQDFNLSSEQVKEEVQRVEENLIQSVVPESVGLLEASTWYQGSHYGRASSLASSVAHSSVSRGSHRREGQPRLLRDLVKRTVLKRLSLYVTGKSGKNAIIPEDRFQSVAKNLVDKFFKKIVEAQDASSLLRTSDVKPLYDDEMKAKVMKSVDTYIQRNFKTQIDQE